MLHDHFGERVERRDGHAIARFHQLDLYQGIGSSGRVMSVGGLHLGNLPFFKGAWRGRCAWCSAR
jgi:hypothetical protein